MTSSKIITASLSIIVILSSSFVDAETSTLGLDISADHAAGNFNTSMSRLEGHVSLKHIGLTINGDLAEVESNEDNQPHRFVISGKPVQFEQKSANYEISAKADFLIYQPIEEKVELNKNVHLTQRSADNYFEINATNLHITFNNGQPYQLNARGKPARFTHQLLDRTIQIQAEKISWHAENQIAILQQATIMDEQTKFSADELRYNMLTGEISAIGKGDTRPSYQYAPEQEKGSTKNNDS